MIGHIALGSKVRMEAGPEVTINCLWCGQISAKAQTRRKTEWLALFHVLPIFRVRNVFVRCSACGKEMIARCSLAEMAHINPVTLQHHLTRSQSLVGRVCIVLGVLLFWAPLVGVIPASIGFFYRNQFGHGLRMLSWSGLILSLLITVFGLVGFLVSHGD